jgi:hypothetical protein
MYIGLVLHVETAIRDASKPWAGELRMPRPAVVAFFEAREEERSSHASN